MKAMLKPILVLVAVVVTVVGIVCGSALLWIHTDHFRLWLQSTLNAKIPGSVTIEHHRLWVLKPRVELEGVTLSDGRGDPVAGLKHLAVELAWRPLWRREVYLRTVLVESPWADLILDNETGLNLLDALVPPGRKETAAPAPAETTGLPVTVVLKSFQLTDGRLSFTPADRRLDVQAAGIDLSASGDLASRQASLKMAIADLRFTSPNIHPPQARINVDAHLDGERLNLTAVEVAGGGTSLHLAGTADRLTTLPTVDGRLAIETQLSEIKTLFNLPGDYSGVAEAALSLKGALNNPDAALRLKVAEGRLNGYFVDRARLAVDLTDRQATIDDSGVHLAGGAIDLEGRVDLREFFAGGFLASPGDPDTITYALTLAPDIPDLAAWLTPLIDITGELSGRVTVGGRGVTPTGMSSRVTASASGKRLLAPGMDRPLDVRMDLSAALAGGRISVDRLDLAGDGLTLTGQGHAGLEEQAIGGNLRLIVQDLSQSLAVVGVSAVDGSANLALTVGGTRDRPQVDLQLAARQLQANDIRVGDLDIAADLTPDGRLNLKALTLVNQESRLKGSGRLRLQPEGGIDPDFDNRVDLTFTALSAADFLASPPVKGSLDGRLQVAGPLSSLQGVLVANAAGLGSAAATIGDIESRLRWDDGTVHVERLVLSNRSSVLRAEGNMALLAPGTLNLLEDPAFALTATSDHIDPGDFIDSVKGSFALDATLSGTLGQPSGTILLRGSGIEAGGQSIQTVDLDARIEKRRLWLDRLVAAVAPGASIAVSGWVDRDRSMDLAASSEGIAFAHIQHIRDRFPGTGTLRLAATARGQLDNPDVEGRLTVSDITINDQPMDDMHLTFGLQDRRIRAAGDLNFEMEADCDLRQGDFALQLIFDDTETDAYFRAAGMPDLNGSLTGQVKAAGNLREILDATVQADISDLHLRLKQTSLLKSDRIRVDLANRILTLPEQEMAILSSGHLRLSGDARLDGDLNLRVDGRIPLAAAGAFQRELADAAGIIVLDGNVSGTAGKPHIDARLDLENIALQVPGLVQKLHTLNGRIHLTEETIRVDALKGFLDTGSFSLAGRIDHEAFTPKRLDLSLNTRALPLEIPDTLFVLLNSDLTLTGSDRSAEARGEIVVLEGLYYKDVRINLLQLATTRQRAVPPAHKPLEVPYFDEVDLNVTIRHRQPFAVENNLAQLEISPDLKVGGTLANPILSGRAQVQEGTVLFQKKTFTVQKGVIDFVNPYRTEAEIDIVSQAAIRTWTITLTIKGTPDNLDLQLSSVPSETDSDILSLILFGRTARELTAGEGGAQRTTGQIMAELIADTFGDDIKARTGVDILQVEENGAGDDETGGMRVTVGKHLSDRMTLKYAVESKDGEIVQRAITEYKLLENILVSGFQDTRGIYGSELVFRIEFR